MKNGCGRTCARWVAKWGVVGYKCGMRTGVEGLLPLLHLGPRPTSPSGGEHLAAGGGTSRCEACEMTDGLPRHLRPHPRRQEPAHDPGEVPGFAERGRRPLEGD